MWSGGAVSSPQPLLRSRALWGTPLFPVDLRLGPFSFSSPSLLLRKASPISSPVRLLRPRGSPAALAATAALVQDGGAAALVLAGAYSLVRAFDTLTERNLIERSLSRKVVHVLSGLLFMSSWPIFRELLRGPLYYVVVLMFCSVVFWRDSPVGVVSLAMMSGGDGFADILGRRYGATKLPYNRQKSWIGSISMFIFGFFFSIGMLYYFSAFGCFHLDWDKAVERVAVVSLAATVVESLPVTEFVDDNISVPLTSMLTASLLFGSH
ncbi:probable phytol kinase 2, chloroplastic isoform X3 [Phoenix dactylifera]|uniref:phytol kinase n=1 Tax=Phoenix dactylifera TaxID=42345 RepID=A0A8B8J6V2_PHODC|nr:probable phytol kinase 2, chloroplastic isoform X3 [Phoenix dactylifera]